jgi:hypothetical protein
VTQSGEGIKKKSINGLMLADLPRRKEKKSDICQIQRGAKLRLTTQRPTPGKIQLCTYVRAKKDRDYEDCVDNSEKIFRLLHSDYFKKNASTTSSTTSASSAAYHARGLVIAHSRKLSATLGGSTSTRP